MKKQNSPMPKHALMYVPDWEDSLNIDVRFSWATAEQKRQILAEIEYQREQSAEGMRLWMFKNIRRLGLRAFIKRGRYEG